MQNREGNGFDFRRRYGHTGPFWAERGDTIEDCIGLEKRIKR